MSKKGLTRREFLRAAGAATAGAVVGSKLFGAPTVIKAQGDPDLSDPAQVGKALTAEGAELMLKSWGFSGLPESTFIPQFAEYTKKLYGVPVKLQWYQGDFDKKMTELPLAGKNASGEGNELIDKKKEGDFKIMRFEMN